MVNPTTVLKIFRPIFWLAVIVLYMIVGGAVFQAVESRQRIDYGGLIAQVNVTALKVSLSQKYNLTGGAIENIYSEFQDAIETQRLFTEQLEERDHRDLSRWEFLDSCAFAMSVFTTTGYGFLYPKTTLGKWLTFLYAIVGIPLFIKFVCVQGGIINELNLLIAKAVLPADKPCIVKGCKIILAGLMMVMFLLVAGAFHMLGSGWEYLTGIYYSFVSVSTIGFGDLCYLFSETQEGVNRKVMLVFHMIVMFIGFAILGAIITAVYDVKSYPKAKHSKDELDKKKVKKVKDEENAPEAAI